MGRVLKNLRINFMYWRFRYITRNRLRLQSWLRRKQPTHGYRPRANAAVVYHRSGRRTWGFLLAMVLAWFRSTPSAGPSAAYGVCRPPPG